MGVLFHEVLAPGSPASKKRQTMDMARKLKKRRLEPTAQTENVTVETEHDTESKRLEVCIEDSFIGSPRRDTSFKSIFEETTLPPPSSPIPIFVPILIVSPTFIGVMQKQSEKLVFHSSGYDSEIQKLRDDAKAHHELFIVNVNEIKESLDVKVDEIKSWMSDEVKRIDKNYKELQGKFDVLAGALTRLVDFTTKYTKQLEAKSEKNAKRFEKIEKFLSSIKETLSKVDLSNQSSISL
ncbi:unnamed protein product [Lactuca virosa]|uniref:Uncharacterized protein n=1 Tax=Lactuca virosa TaxID=75947 RepID=A0AAU9PJV0_9ASTR|nr:unnamed protein product [Lactuca virosa]